MNRECVWPYCGADDPCDMHTEETNMREKESVPLPEPDLGSIRVGREDICLGHSDEAMRAYGDERERAAHARVAELEAQLAEMTRRRNAWKARAPDIKEFNALREAVRKGINDAGDRDLSRVFLRGALVERNKTIAELEAERDEFSTIAKAAEDKLADAQEMQFAMLSLLADIRKAAGDPEGRLMLSELVESIAMLRTDALRYRWLRDLPEDSPHEHIGNCPGYEWDRLIDDAIAAGGVDE